MGIFDGSLLVAGIIYHNYDKQHGVIEVSAGSSSKRWMTKDILRQFLSMPFTLLGCQTIVARHAEDRRALRRMWCSVGAVEYLIPRLRGRYGPCEVVSVLTDDAWMRSEEHTSELQSLMRISYAVFCLKKKKKTNIANYY